MNRFLIGLLFLLILAYCTFQPNARLGPNVIILNPKSNGLNGLTASKFSDVCTVRGKVVDSAWVCTPPTDIDEVLERRGDN